MAKSSTQLDHKSRQPNCVVTRTITAPQSTAERKMFRDAKVNSTLRSPARNHQPQKQNDERFCSRAEKTRNERADNKSPRAINTMRQLWDGHDYTKFNGRNKNNTASTYDGTKHKTTATQTTPQKHTLFMATTNSMLFCCAN